MKIHGTFLALLHTERHEEMKRHIYASFRCAKTEKRRKKIANSVCVGGGGSSYHVTRSEI
jgi:hypothetical protein